MKRILLALACMFVMFSFVRGQSSADPGTAIFVVVDAKADKSPEAVAKELRKDLKKVLKKLKGSEVSEISKSSFATEFGNIPDVQWQRQDFFDVATFTKDGQTMKAYFGNDGQLIGTVTKKSFEDLPEKAKERIKEKYPDYTVNDVILYTDNQNQVSDILLFGIEMESESNYFVELTKENKRIILQVSPEGKVSFFKELKS